MNQTPTPNRKGEKGQILIIFVIALVVIFGFVALAIDGSAVYLDRRRAQNAADSAALSAAYAMCSGEDPLTAAENIVQANGFIDNGKEIVVDINNPPASGPYATSSDKMEYTEVIITTVRGASFGFFVSNTPLASTVRSVSHCHVGSGPGSSEPGLGGEVAILALNKTKAEAFTNTGNASVIVDGGVFINSTADSTSKPSQMALHQNGTATLLMNWIKIRGGAGVEGAFGIYTAGASSATKQIDIAGNLRTSGAGKAITGLFNIGGNVDNTASINMTADALNVSGYFNNSGAGTINSPDILIGGNISNGGSGTFTSKNMQVGGNIVSDGGSLFQPISGQTLNMTVDGNINLSGSAKINGNVTLEGTYTHSGTGAITGTLTQATISPDPSFSMPAIPAMDDPLASVLQPPEPPTGSCQSVSLPNWGGSTSNRIVVPMANGGYYCDLTVGGSVVAELRPGTYWVNSFDLGGAADLLMDGVHLYIKSGGFKWGGSAKLSMLGTMLYIKGGVFSFSGGSGTLNWTAPGLGDPYQGLVLYMDRGNSSTVSQNGSTSLGNVSGTWYAPASHCSFTGNTNTTIYSQFICDTVAVQGSSSLIIKYDGNLIYQKPVSGTVSEVNLTE